MKKNSFIGLLALHMFMVGAVSNLPLCKVRAIDSKVDFVESVIVPLAELCDLTEQERDVVRAIAQCCEGDCGESRKGMVRDEDLDCIIDKIKNDEVVAKILCFRNYVEQEYACHCCSEDMARRSLCCSCPCPEIEDFVGDDAISLCDVYLEKAAVDQLLVSNTACFNGHVNFASGVCGIPGGLCWTLRECSDWDGSQSNIPTECIPACGEVVLNSLDTANISGVAFSYHSKDGVDHRCLLRALVNGANAQNVDPSTLLLPILQLFDASQLAYPDADVYYVARVVEAGDNDDDCYVVLTTFTRPILADGTFAGQACIGFEKLNAIPFS